MMEVFTKEQLSEAIENNKEKVVLVEFYAAWCGPCKLFSEELKQLEKNYKHLIILKINIDKASQLARVCSITSVPTVILFKNGQKVYVEAGFKNWQVLGNIIENIEGKI